MSGSTARPGSVAVGCLLAVGLLAGCGTIPQPAGEAAPSTSQHPPGRWMSAMAAGREYVAATGELTLRPGSRWPRDPTPPSSYQGEPVRYQVGYGRQAAQFRWYCSWATAAVDRRLPPRDRRESLERAVRIRRMQYFTALNRRNQRFFGRVLDRAVAGDLRLLERDVKLNCADQSG